MICRRRAPTCGSPRAFVRARRSPSDAGHRSRATAGACDDVIEAGTMGAVSARRSRHSDSVEGRRGFPTPYGRGCSCTPAGSGRRGTAGRGSLTAWPLGRVAQEFAAGSSARSPRYPWRGGTRATVAGALRFPSLAQQADHRQTSLATSPTSPGRAIAPCTSSPLLPLPGHTHGVSGMSLSFPWLCFAIR